MMRLSSLAPHSLARLTHLTCKPVVLITIDGVPLSDKSRIDSTSMRASGVVLALGRCSCWVLGGDRLACTQPHELAPPPSGRVAARRQPGSSLTRAMPSSCERVITAANDGPSEYDDTHLSGGVRRALTAAVCGRAVGRSSTSRLRPP